MKSLSLAPWKLAGCSRDSLSVVLAVLVVMQLSATMGGLLATTTAFERLVWWTGRSSSSFTGLPVVVVVVVVVLLVALQLFRHHSTISLASQAGALARFTCRRALARRRRRTRPRSLASIMQQHRRREAIGIYHCRRSLCRRRCRRHKGAMLGLGSAS